VSSLFCGRPALLIKFNAKTMLLWPIYQRKQDYEWRDCRKNLILTTGRVRSPLCLLTLLYLTATPSRNSFWIKIHMMLLPYILKLFKESNVLWDFLKRPKKGPLWQPRLSLALPLKFQTKYRQWENHILYTKFFLKNPYQLNILKASVELQRLCPNFGQNFLLIHWL